MTDFVGLVQLAGAILIGALAWPAGAQEPRRLVLPEQRHFEIRDPSQLCPARIPDMPSPATVTENAGGRAERPLSLDEAIHIALENADVIRIVTGTTAVASGETIYEPAISNTAIDRARAAFDPRLSTQNTWARTDQPTGISFPLGPLRPSAIVGNPIESFQSTTTLSKNFLTGGQVGLSVDSLYTHAESAQGSLFGLNPQTASNVTLSATQPLLQGAGAAANMAPILIARINTEQSFFAMKDSVQDLVLGVIQTYWNLSLAQTQAWSSRQQVQQGREALERAEARLQAGLGDVGDVAQARVSYGNFQAALVTAEASVLNQEALLRNLLGQPPSQPTRITLTTAPSTERQVTDWANLLRLAGQYRPDIVQLKLILEADQQNLLLSRNQALPQLNLSALYRWNGLEGETASGRELETFPGQFGDWQAGVNFSVPLGLRKERAAVRDRELLIMRDRANLEQSMHGAAHLLAGSYRNLDQYYQQYQLYRRTREAALANVQRQMADYTVGRRTLYLNVLLAITDWGNAVNNEYQALVQYVTEQARLERQTGTILESHGVRFVEERYGSIGPLGRFFADRCYPADARPGPNAESTPVPPEQQYHRPEPPSPTPEEAKPPETIRVPILEPKP